MHWISLIRLIREHQKQRLWQEQNSGGPPEEAKTDPQFMTFLQHVQQVFANAPSALSIDAINCDIQQALNDLTI